MTTTSRELIAEILCAANERVARRPLALRQPRGVVEHDDAPGRAARTHAHQEPAIGRQGDRGGTESTGQPGPWEHGPRLQVIVRQGHDTRLAGVARASDRDDPTEDRGEVEDVSESRDGRLCPRSEVVTGPHLATAAREEKMPADISDARDVNARLRERVELLPQNTVR